MCAFWVNPYLDLWCISCFARLIRWKWLVVVWMWACSGRVFCVLLWLLTLWTQIEGGLNLPLIFPGIPSSAEAEVWQLLLLMLLLDVIYLFGLWILISSPCNIPRRDRLVRQGFDMMNWIHCTVYQHIS